MTERANSPKVSVVIPTYNSDRFLKECIDSVLAQSDPDCEAIVVDDCSTDNSQATVKRLFGGNSRVKYFKLPENRGQAFARNFGLRQSTSEYIAFLDSDDLWLPEKLRSQLQFLETRHVDWTACQVEDVDLLNKTATVRSSIDPSRSLLLQILSESASIPMSTILIRRSALETARFFDAFSKFRLERFPKYLYGAEHFACLLIFSSLELEFDVLKQPLAKYRLHGANISINRNFYLKYCVYLVYLIRYQPFTRKLLFASYALIYLGKFLLAEVKAGVKSALHRFKR